MAVPIINTLSEMSSFNSYASTQSYVYGSVAEALESGRYLQPVPTPNQINATGAQLQVVEFQPNITGGTKAGAGIVNFVRGTGRCETFVYGDAIALNGIEILGGIVAGLGLSIASYELNKDFWVDVSNNAFQNFPGYTPVTYDNIEEMSIVGLFKNNKTYVPYEVIQSVANYLYSIGAYNEDIRIEYDRPLVAGNYDITSVEMTKSNIFNIVTNAINSCGYPIPTKTALRLCIEPLINGMTGLANFGACKVQIYASQPISDISQMFNCQIDVTFTNRTFPVNVDITDSNIKLTYTNVGSYWTPSNGYFSGRATGTLDNPSVSFTQGGSQGWESFIDGVARNNLNEGSLLTTSIGNVIEITPVVPELTPLPNSIPVEAPNSIPLEFPEWWAQKETVSNPETETPYLPISVPGVSPKTHPVPLTTPQTGIQTGTVPDTNPKPVENGPIGIFTPSGGVPQPKEPNPPVVPTPIIPVIPAIGGQANKLFTVYNPSQANLDALGGVLWSQNVIQQIIQMFTNNPLDAIISLHILYATPTTGANKEIKLGYVPTGVACPEVTNQYVNIDCGTVIVPELFGDVRDYANTDITIYLPMIGFRQLKTEDAMASYISVDYKVDVFTGTVLANVTVTRDSTDQVFYTFEGNCAVNLPLTGADKSRQLATAVGVIGSVVTGNPVMGMASATAIAGGSARANIQRSGNFTGNAGAMGCKKPYIIVSSDIPYDAVGYNTQYGFPANLTVMLGSCHGYVKAKEVHADTIANATEQEKREIENQLKQGVIIH